MICYFKMVIQLGRDTNMLLKIHKPQKCLDYMANMKNKEAENKPKHHISQNHLFVKVVEQ